MIMGLSGMQSRGQHNLKAVPLILPIHFSSLWIPADIPNCRNNFCYCSLYSYSVFSLNYGLCVLNTS